MFLNSQVLSPSRSWAVRVPWALEEAGTRPAQRSGPSRVPLSGGRRPRSREPGLTGRGACRLGRPRTPVRPGFSPHPSAADTEIGVPRPPRSPVALGCRGGPPTPRGGPAGKPTRGAPCLVCAAANRGPSGLIWGGGPGPPGTALDVGNIPLAAPSKRGRGILCFRSLFHLVFLKLYPKQHLGSDFENAALPWAPRSSQLLERTGFVSEWCPCHQQPGTLGVKVGNPTVPGA